MKPSVHTLEDFFVRFAETDAAGIVHFTHFLRWAENAECDFFTHNSLKNFEKTTTGTILGWPRVAVSIRYIAPAYYADKIRVSIRPIALPKDEAKSIEWHFEIARVDNDNAQTLLAVGSWTTVLAKMEPNRTITSEKCIPEDVFSVLKSFF